MFENEKLLLELCQQAAREQDSKKLRELTRQIERLLAEVCGNNQPLSADDRLPTSS